MKNQKKIFAIGFTLLLAISLSVSSATTINTYAASKKYTKTYNLKRNYRKTVKLKSTIKSVKSSNKKIATIKKSGKKFTITTKKKGTAIITVKCKNKKTYRYKVKVSNKKHKHSWKDKTWTEDVVNGQMVNYYVCNSCESEFTDYPSLEAHQASTGWDGTPAHHGWHNNNKWIETITQIIHHYRECACGAREDID